MNLNMKKQLVDTDNQVFLPRDSNQALGIGQFAIDFMQNVKDKQMGPGPSQKVLDRVELFHTDSVVCGVSALAMGTNAPTVLKKEALEYPMAYGATVLGVKGKVRPEKAILVNASAVREWDSNGTVFGYNPKFGHTAGEFGHNDFYGVVVAACQMKGLDGNTAAHAMILSDEIRGRLAEVFSLKSYKIDHVVHGAIASAAVFGALMGATAKQIECAIGMFVAHFIPWRAIRAGHQLSDSKGSSAAISTEAAILCMLRSMRGFLGPQDIFRNPQSMFRQFEKTEGDSPFDLVLSHSGDDFAVMGMHFKLGLYEHQSAGALQGLITLMQKNPSLLTDDIKSIQVVAYEPAYGIIGDPAKRDPHTRQSADHSMVFILSRKLIKAREAAKLAGENDDIWKQLILTPYDYSPVAVNDPATRAIMEKIEFAHGGKEYDDKYPDGIPTSVIITNSKGEKFDSGLVMYPAGHARNVTADLNGILQNKFKVLGALAVVDVDDMVSKLENLTKKSAADVDSMYDIELAYHKVPIDELTA